MVKQL